MSNFFENLPDTLYRFGDNELPVLFNNLSVYVDVIDQVKSSIEYYAPYTIQPEDRPDIVSYKLYETTDYHWTFFLMNDNLRKGGWPLTNDELDKNVKAAFHNQVVTTTDTITDDYLIGERVEGKISGAVGYIVDRRLDMGHLVIETEDHFLTPELLISGDTLGEQQGNSINIVNSTHQYVAPLFYVNENNEPVDIDPHNPNLTNLTPISLLEEQIRLNDELKQIFVLKKDVIDSVIAEFKNVL